MPWPGRGGARDHTCGISLFILAMTAMALTNVKQSERDGRRERGGGGMVHLGVSGNSLACVAAREVSRRKVEANIII